MKWYEEKEGTVSMMRIASMIGSITGIIIALLGTVAMFLNLPAATAITGIGAGIYATALGTKMGQKYAEGN